MAFGAKIKLAVDRSNEAAFRKDIQDFVDKVTQGLNSGGGVTVKVKEFDTTAAVEKLKKDIQVVLNGMNIAGLKDFIDTGSIKDAGKQMNDVKKKTAETVVAMKSLSSLAARVSSALNTERKNGLDTSSEQIKQLIQNIDEYLVRVQKLKEGTFEQNPQNIQILKDEGEQLTKLIQDLQTARKEAEKTESAIRSALNANFKKVTTQYNNFNDTVISDSANANNPTYAAADVDKIKAAYESLKSTMEELKETNKDVSKERAAQIEKEISDLGLLITTAEAARKANIQNAKEQSKRAEQTEKELEREAKQRAENERHIAEATEAARKQSSVLSQGWEKLNSWLFSTRAVMAAIRVVRQMVDAVRELDAAMTELRKVTDLSEQAYRDFTQTASRMAQSVGATLADTINATADFARLGYDLTDSTALAEAALVYKNVGDGINSIGDASESIISTIKAFEQFGESATDAMSIVDRFNEVGKQNCPTVQKCIEGK